MMTGNDAARRRAILVAGVLSACAVWPLLDTARTPVPPHAADAADATDTREWPTTWEGRPLRPLAASAVEQRFAEHFPGRLVRLTDGEQVLMWREVTRPTRMLHPATDCYRALGYRIEQARLERDAQARLWRCFHATRDGRTLRVCERIEDARGGDFTDTSAWYWAAALGRSTGPWQAYTTARPL